ncbi:hypothetical protein M595_2782 [Lyngbya aestuarii BL J]|uniref:Lipopolysaccharide assembly protein A domain-containing protein n=1 Tax=Lyngbya aestuarii BL J TaxID=1348334 RepID=U7QH44_9CYAN|nr:hypothetical protein [Lyngbya aestuarii]ERT07218.1 hypothetical protein M595_2782 [Lyngbya aestuarii BL J]
MSVANLVIFLIAVAGLALLVAQNLSPSVSLVFLGTQSPAFPLSFWIVMAISVGVILSLLIWGLFQLSGSGSTVARSSPSRSPKPPVQPPTGFTPEPTSSYSAGQNPPNTTKTSTGYSPPPPRSTTSATDDWETEVRPIRQSWDEEDWGLDEEESIHSTPSQTAWKEQEGSSDLDDSEPTSEASEQRSSNDLDSEYSRRDHYEVEQKPKQQSWSGSVYSYGYREGEDTGVGKSESVYDADYRIITPPPPATEIQDQEEEEEDWELQESEADPEESSSRSTDEQSQTNDDRRSTEY